MINVFTYGSLMYPSIWSRVASGHYRHTEGCIIGYRRVVIRDRVHPALISGDKEIWGVIWFRVSQSDLEKLDEFEGIYYRRDQIKAKTSGGRSVPCHVYTWKEDYRSLLLEKDWDKLAFEIEGAEHFQSNYEGFSR